MVIAANLPYGWTNFVGAIDGRYHRGLAAIQLTFTMFVLVATWLVSVEGYLVDRYGPRPVVIGGRSWCRWRPRSASTTAGTRIRHRDDNPCGVGHHAAERWSWGNSARGELSRYPQHSKEAHQH